MKVQFLGTAAAEGVPGIFCECDVCKRSRIAGGRNIRTRSQAIVDDKILIDFCPDTYWHEMQYGIDMPNIHTCLMTHSHEDHLNADEFSNRRKGFAHINNPEKLMVYGSRKSLSPIANLIFSINAGDCMDTVVVKAFEPFEREGYTVTPLTAIHDPSTDPLIYMLQKDGKAFIYGTDTGIFCDEVLKYLVDNKVYLNMVSMDCTGCFTDVQYPYHMDLGKNVFLKNRLIELGVCDEKTIFISNHFSHNGLATYDDVVPVAAKDGIEVSYDGMIVEF